MRDKDQETSRFVSDNSSLSCQTAFFYKAPRCHGDGHFESAENFIIVITSTGKKPTAHGQNCS